MKNKSRLKKDVSIWKGIKLQDPLLPLPFCEILLQAEMLPILIFLNVNNSNVEMISERHELFTWKTSYIIHRLHRSSFCDFCYVQFIFNKNIKKEKK